MYAFPKSARLRRSEEFRETLNQGVKAVSSQIVLVARVRAEGVDATREARLGLIVSKKVGESVTRSRVKRHVREAFRHMAPDLAKHELLRTMDLVAIARPSAASATSADIAAALDQCLGRLSRQLRQGPHA